jgi:hypothetical protein
MSDPEKPETPPANPEPPVVGIDDADDLRGWHFRKLLGETSTWIWIGCASIGLGAIIAVAFSLVIGLIVFAATILIGLWVTFMVADSRAADDFFTVYARNHNLALGGKSVLPASTPLLRKGDDRYAERTLTGELAPGVGGLLALYTWIDESTDSKGNRQKNYHRFTLGMSEIDECVRHVPELYCQRKSGLRSLEGFEDLFRRSKERVTLESEAMGDKYEIFSGKGQDQVWLRRFFTPTFIVWLAESAPDGFAFELVNGTLVAYIRGRKEDSADLDRVAAATGMVATRLREESVQTSEKPSEA